MISCLSKHLWVSPLLFCHRILVCHRIVKRRVQHRVECYEIEWQNVSLREFCRETFVTIERRDVSLSFTMYPVINRFSRIEVCHWIAFAPLIREVKKLRRLLQRKRLNEIVLYVRLSFATVPCWSRCIKQVKCPLARLARMVFM